jgi:hypothetical protein
MTTSHARVMCCDAYLRIYSAIINSSKIFSTATTSNSLSAASVISQILYAERLQRADSDVSDSCTSNDLVSSITALTKLSAAIEWMRHHLIVRSGYKGRCSQVHKIGIAVRSSSPLSIRADQTANY